MTHEPYYLHELRRTLKRSKALCWRDSPYKAKAKVSKHIKDKVDTLFRITYPQLRKVTEHVNVSNVHTRTQHSMLNKYSQKLLSFEVDGLGHVIYLFMDDVVSRFWFIPQKYVGLKPMTKAINKLHERLIDFTAIPTLLIYITRLQGVVDYIDVMSVDYDSVGV